MRVNTMIATLLPNYDYFADLDLRDPAVLAARFDDFLDALENGDFLRQDLPQPQQPWHEIAQTLVQHSLSDPFDTVNGSSEAFYHGWPTLLACLAAHGEGLPLPLGATEATDVFPSALRHRVALQSCFEWLTGIGSAGLSLHDSDQQGRVTALIDALRDHRDSVAACALTLDGLLARLQLPPSEAQQLAILFTQHLGLTAATRPLIHFL